MEKLLSSSLLLELPLGLMVLTLVIFVHGVGVRAVHRHFNRSWTEMYANRAAWRSNLILAGAISGLAGLHLLSTLLWALPLWSLGLITDFRMSYYFVLSNYTTLGDEAVRLPAEWQLIAPLIAISGLFTFAWTGSIIVTMMSEFGKFDRAQARSNPD